MRDALDEVHLFPLSTMSWNPCTRFWRIEREEDSLGHEMGEEQPVQALPIDASPGGLSLEEGTSVCSSRYHLSSWVLRLA